MFSERRGRALRSGLLGPVFPAKRRKKFVEMPQQTSRAPARASGAKNRAFSPSHQRPRLPVQALKTQCLPGQFSAFRERNLCLGKGRQKRQMPDLPSGFRQKRLYLYLLLSLYLYLFLYLFLGQQLLP